MDTASLVQPGRQLELFEIVQELPGTLEVPEHPYVTAGYADIYRGYWTTPQGERVQVAIKEFRTPIPRDRQTEREALEWKADVRLKREAFVWSQTTHPNIHPLLGYRSRPRPWLISPWCSQGNLKDYLEMSQGLTRYDKLCLIFQTSCGLEHLHSQTPPICHADIKPENVLVNDRNGLALSDFGLSRVVQDLNARSGFTTSETVKGSVRYMAPELFAGKKSSLETDVYAFGGLILTVMSGKPPFDDLPHEVILNRVSSDEPPVPEDHPNLPAHDPLWKLMRRCWNYDSTARPTMQRVLRELLGEIRREEFILEPGAGEYRDMDLEILGTMQHAGHLPLILTPGYSLALGVPLAGVECNAIPKELLLDTRATLEKMKMSANVIPVIGKYIRTAAEVGLSLVDIVEAMNESKNPSASLEFNPLKLANRLQDLEEKSRQRRGGNIRARVTEIQSELEVAQRKLKKRYSSNLVRDESASAHDASREWCQGTAQKVLEEIKVLVTLNTSGLIDEFENPELQEHNRHLLHHLGDGNYGAQGNAIADVICLPGTRVEILERIDNWIRDKSSSDRVFWIRGMAGRGKSTIASTVAHNWQSRASCAIFHFRRGHDTVNASIVRALARQLGSSLHPEVRKAILESVQENPDIAVQRLEVQFETLIVVPLSKLVHQSRTILFIVDALDECQNPKDAVAFVKLIDRHFSSFPTNVKFLLTCRPEAPLLRSLEPREWPVEDLDSSGNVANDLARFIKHGCMQIRGDYGLPEDWPASSDIKSLVGMSQGLFQWAQTVITYVNDGSPVNRLRDLLSRPSTLDGLDDLYHQILSKAFNTVRQDPVRQELLCSILATLVVAPYPVSLHVIAGLYGDNSIFEGVDQDGVIEYLRQDILVGLKSLLFIPTSPTESICLMHTSIHDLLVNERRCKERIYYIDVHQHHERLASICLEIMVRSLIENICNLSDLSKPNSELQDVIDREVSTVIRYCCRAWSIHLTEGAEWPRLIDSQQAVFETFTKEKLLYWLEVMSLIGATTEAAVIAKRVSVWLSQSHDRAIFDCKPLAILWNDAQRFITAFSEPISFGALHVYASALAHCPQNTQLWECYGRLAKIRTVCGVLPLAWPANLWTREYGKFKYVKTVAFSSDGAVLASGFANDCTIRLWDAQTGTPLGQPLTGHNSHVWSVAFSPDGRVLASGSTDRTIRLWDAQTGTPLGQPLIGHTSWVQSVVYSPDGRVLASGSLDGTIRLWEAQTGTPLSQPLTGHNHYVYSVAFSPDGRVLASGSEDCTVRLWDAQSGMPLGQPLTGHNCSIIFVKFSPDGRVLFSGSLDHTIRLWDAQTGALLGQPLTGHTHRVCSVELSPDGTVLASGSSNGTIRLWNSQTGTPLGQPLTGHDDNVSSVAFSPDGRVLASGSDDHTIQMWDAQTGMALGRPLTGHSDWAHSGAFSPEGTVLVSGSEEGTNRVWDAQTGTPLSRPLIDGSNWVRSVAFSPDGTVLASGSDDGKIRLWDADTRTPLGEPLIGHDGNVNSVAFSPDGRALASGSDDGTIRLWDAQTGTPLGQPLTGHNDDVYSVAFSPDSKVLASGSEDGTIRLWDAQTGTPQGQLFTGDKSWVRSVAFSPDGRVLASLSLDGMIRLWEAQTGTPLGEPLISHKWCLTYVAFSPDGRALASGSDDGTIRLWDAQTGTPLGQPLADHNGWVLASACPDGTIRLWDAQTGTLLGQPLKDHHVRACSVALSPDSRFLASGSEDGTIRFWDAQTRTPLGEPLICQADNIDVHSVALSPDGRVLASGHWNGTIRLWDAQTGTPLGEPLTGHYGYVCSVAFSPDGSVLVSGSQDRTIRFWDPKTGRPLGQPLKGHHGCVCSVAISPDGRVLASGSDDRTIQLWDAQTVTPLGQPLTGHNDRVRSVAFSPDGTTLASGSEDFKIRLWDAQTGTPSGQPLTGHTHRVWSVAFSPDGRVLASGSWDDTIRLWDPHTGTPLGQPVKGGTFRVSFAPILNRAYLGPPVGPSTYCIPNFLDHWVRLSSSRLFWLPSQYWAREPPTILLSNGTLVIESGGKLSIFDVSHWQL